ncbi:MAG: hypothetical protein RL173_153 [Fibrobacterota bacterium]|jgi:hypothetical protein
MRQNPFLTSALLALALWSCEKSTDPALDNSDPIQTTDRRAQAIILSSDGTSHSGKLASGTVDWFKFATDSGETYAIQQACDQPICPNARTLSAFIDSATTPFLTSTNGRIEFQATKSDTIFASIEGRATIDGVETSSFQYHDTVGYTISATMTSPPALPIGRAQATFLSTDGKLHSGNLASGNVHWFKFFVEPGADYTIQKGCDRAVCLLNTKFLAFANSSQDAFSSSTNGIIEFTARGYDTIYASLEGEQPEDNGSYTIYVDGNGWANAVALTTDGVAYDGSLYTPRIQRFRFKVDSGTTYSIQKSCNKEYCAQETILRAYTLDSTAPFSTSTSGFLRFTATKSGAVYLGLAITSANWGTYDIRIDAEPPTATMSSATETMSSATELVLGNPDIGKTISGITENWFRFHADSGKAYAIVLSADSAKLLNPSFWTVDSARTTDTVVRKSESRTEFIFPKTGTYYFKVTSPSIVKYGTRLLKLDRLPSWYTGMDDYEPDSTMQDALTIPVDVGLFRHTIKGGDLDWIRFHADSGTTYKVLPRNLGRSIFSSDSVAQTPITSIDPDGSAYFVARSTGDYFVRYTTTSSSYVEYWPQVFTVPNDRYEPDDTPEDAKEIPTDGTTQERLMTGTLDVIKFQAKKGISYTVRIINKSPKNPLDLNIKPDRNYWFDYYDTSYTGLAPAAVDTVKELHFKSSYRFAYSVCVVPNLVDSFENDSSLATAKPISTDGTVQHRSITNTDQDWISFEVDSGASYRVEAKSRWNDRAISMDLYTIDGLPLDAQSTAPAISKTIAARRQTTYFVRITKPQTYLSTMDYVLQVTKL